MRRDRLTGDRLQTWDDVWLVGVDGAPPPEPPVRWPPAEDPIDDGDWGRVWKTWDDIGIADDLGVAGNETAPDSDDNQNG